MKQDCYSGNIVTANSDYFHQNVFTYLCDLIKLLFWPQLVTTLTLQKNFF